MGCRAANSRTVGARRSRSAGSIWVVVRFSSMTKPKLIYFDAPVSRGEECRLALHLAGIDFEDARINPAAWHAMKEQMPYGGLPVLELPDVRRSRIPTPSLC